MWKKQETSLDDSNEGKEAINMLKRLLETLRNNERPMEDLRNQLR